MSDFPYDGPEPTDAETELAYELLGPAPLTMAPVLWMGRMLARRRELLLAPFEALARSLPPREAARLRALLAAARGHL